MVEVNKQRIQSVVVEVNKQRIQSVHVNKHLIQSAVEVNNQRIESTVEVNKQSVQSTHLQSMQVKKSISHKYRTISHLSILHAVLPQNPDLHIELHRVGSI